MMKAFVTFEVTKSGDVSKVDFIDWINHELNKGIGLDISNAMLYADLRTYVENLSIEYE